MNYFERINYCAETGVFTWAVSARGISRGSRAGCLSSHGYWVIKIGRKQYRACRVAWFKAHGEWPVGEVDHINGIKTDDRLCNLRVVSRAENSQNKGEAQANNRSCGLLGATWNRQHKRWQAKICANGKHHFLGYFSNPEAAHVAYMAAKTRLHIGGRSH